MRPQKRPLREKRKPESNRIKHWLMLCKIKNFLFFYVRTGAIIIVRPRVWNGKGPVKRIKMIILKLTYNMHQAFDCFVAKIYAKAY